MSEDNARLEKETEQLVEEYEDASEMHDWYREELLEMVPDERGTELWDDYQRKLTKTGQREMRLARKLRARGVDV